MIYAVVKSKVIGKILGIYHKKNIAEYCLNHKERKDCCKNFTVNSIAHSDFLLNYDKCSAKKYDIFIAGSDQVWNLHWYYPAFFLDFVNGKEKKKISYAASISMDSLTDEQKEIFKKHLADFSAVSVRETSDVELIKDLSPVPVVNTLDPTLLLSKEDWDKVCADRVVDEKYLFCYFLGDSKHNRKLAKQYANKHNLKIVNLPHMNCYRQADNNFGDYQLYDVGPEKWLSLVKYAECVFTDSFHAVAFSNIYEKQFFVFNRSKKAEMSSRIYNITQMFSEENRYCDSKEKETIQYLMGQPNIEYPRNSEKFEQLKKISIDFLKDNIC